MPDKLLKYFSKIMPLSPAEIEAIVATLTIKYFKKGSVLLREGQISAEAYFVLEGCVRQYYLVDGEEKTSNFFTEEQWVISMNSFNQNLPANHYLECCMDSCLVVGNREKEEHLYKKFPKLETISRIVLTQIFAEQQELMATYTVDTPEQRYLKLLQCRPELLQKIPQYQIASYVGVKPESLSRIKKRIMQKD